MMYPVQDIAEDVPVAPVISRKPNLFILPDNLSRLPMNAQYRVNPKEHYQRFNRQPPPSPAFSYSGPFTPSSPSSSFLFSSSSHPASNSSPPSSPPHSKSNPSTLLSPPITPVTPQSLTPLTPGLYQTVSSRHLE